MFTRVSRIRDIRATSHTVRLIRIRDNREAPYEGTVLYGSALNVHFVIIELLCYHCDWFFLQFAMEPPTTHSAISAARIESSRRLDSTTVAWESCTIQGRSSVHLGYTWTATTCVRHLSVFLLIISRMAICPMFSFTCVSAVIYFR